MPWKCTCCGYELNDDTSVRCICGNEEFKESHTVHSPGICENEFTVNKNPKLGFAFIVFSMTAVFLLTVAYFTHRPGDKLIATIGLLGNIIFLTYIYKAMRMQNKVLLKLEKNGLYLFSVSKNIIKWDDVARIGVTTNHIGKFIVIYLRKPIQTSVIANKLKSLFYKFDYSIPLYGIVPGETAIYEAIGKLCPRLLPIVEIDKNSVSNNNLFWQYTGKYSKVLLFILFVLLFMGYYYNLVFIKALGAISITFIAIYKRLHNTRQ